MVYPARELGYDHDESAEQKLHLILAQALLCVCVCVLEEINTQFSCAYKAIHGFLRMPVTNPAGIYLP